MNYKLCLCNDKNLKHYCNIINYSKLPINAMLKFKTTVAELIKL